MLTPPFATAPTEVTLNPSPTSLAVTATLFAVFLTAYALSLAAAGGPTTVIVTVAVPVCRPLSVML